MVPINEQDTSCYMPPTQQLIELEYSAQEDMDDTDWLKQLAMHQPAEFEELTCYHAPIELSCEVHLRIPKFPYN
jgi:hypothetical protein